jgi:hypothetical protein
MPDVAKGALAGAGQFNKELGKIAKGEEVWLAWEITRISGDPAVIAIDNVRITDIADASPFITRQPLPQTVPYGCGVDFDIEASAHGDLAYQWLRDGVAIPGASAATLHLPSPGRAEDGAVFSCRVSSKDGEVLSAPATLKVYAPFQVRGPALPANFKFDASGYSIDPALADVAYLPAGRHETADLYLPDPLPAKCPAVVIVHGGGGNNGDKRQSREAQAGILGGRGRAHGRQACTLASLGSVPARRPTSSAPPLQSPSSPMIRTLAGAFTFGRAEQLLPFNGRTAVPKVTKPCVACLRGWSSNKVRPSVCALKVGSQAEKVLAGLALARAARVRQPGGAAGHDEVWRPGDMWRPEAKRGRAIHECQRERRLEAVL